MPLKRNFHYILTTFRTYAEPYEPVKGGKHHKGLYGTSGPDRKRKRPRLFLFFALIGLLIILGPARCVEKKPGDEPNATNPDTTVVAQAVPGNPDAPEPEPEILINPEEHKDIPESPEEKPEEKPQEKPEEKPQDLPEQPEEPDDPDIPDNPDDPDIPDNHARILLALPEPHRSGVQDHG